MNIHGGLVTGCHDCLLNVVDDHCVLTSNLIYKAVRTEIVDPTCPMLKEENHSITIMLSDQYNKS